MERHSIGTIARRVGIRASAIRYYEAAGILDAPPRVGGQRRYGDDALTQLEVIGMARALGFSMADLRELFGGFPDGATASERWHAVAGRKIAAMDALIERTRAMRATLAESLACGCDTFDTCELLATDAHD